MATTDLASERYGSHFTKWRWGDIKMATRGIKMAMVSTFVERFHRLWGLWMLLTAYYKCMRLNSFLRALSMSVYGLVLSYRRLTNFSMMCRNSSGISLGADDNFNSALASSGNTFLTTHAVFFPWLAKLDTVSHPVREWTIVSACVLSGPSQAAISWAAR